MERTYDLSELWRRVWARRKGIAALVAAATLVTGVVAFLLPPWYRSYASLLPPSEEESGFGIASLIRGISVPGIHIPTQATPVDVFMAILNSRRVNEQVVSRFDLRQRYHKKYLEDALKELAHHRRFKLTEAGTIELQVEDRDPQRAADMASAYIDLLDEFNREVRMTKGRRSRIFLGRRLDETKSEMAQAEQKLADYQAKHKAIALSPELTTAVETAARLFAERTALQVRLGVIRSYTREPTDEERQVQEQLDQLDQQLQSLPGTGLELARLLREVKTQEQLYVLLTAQYEEARLNEVRDVVTVDVLDPPAVPERRSRPRRGVMIVGAFLLSLAVGVAYALFRGQAPEQDPSREYTPSG